MAYPYTYQPDYYGYTTSASTSPGPDGPEYVYQLPRYVPSPQEYASTKRGHVRTTSYQTPRVATWQSPTAYPSADYYSSNATYSSPPVARYANVGTKTSHSKSRRPTVSGNGEHMYHEARPKRQEQHIFVDVSDEAHDHVRTANYEYIKPKTSSAPRTTTHAQKKPAKKADNYFFFNQDPHDDQLPDTATRSRARRPSAGSRPKASGGKPSEATAPATATAADAARHNIPAGYSLKNWDPTERPILVLGSVFDANSLGKWIYDWTVYHHKAGSPLTEVAGELWLLLIKFAGKMKRAEECLPRIRSRENRGMVRDFYISGERIWDKMENLIKLCEEFMWHAAKKEGARGKVRMGEKSGIEFVKSIFGRERELERTEKLMTSVRLWNMRFDANCEEILRRPSAN